MLPKTVRLSRDWQLYWFCWVQFSAGIIHVTVAIKGVMVKSITGRSISFRKSPEETFIQSIKDLQLEGFDRFISDHFTNTFYSNECLGWLQSCRCRWTESLKHFFKHIIIFAGPWRPFITQHSEQLYELLQSYYKALSTLIWIQNGNFISKHSSSTDVFQKLLSKTLAAHA